MHLELWPGDLFEEYGGPARWYGSWTLADDDEGTTVRFSDLWVGTASERTAGLIRGGRRHLHACLGACAEGRELPPMPTWVASPGGFSAGPPRAPRRAVAGRRRPGGRVIGDTSPLRISLMFRNIGAVLAGLVAGGVFNMALVMLNAMVLFPMPPGADMNDPAAMNAYVAGLPVTALLVVLVAHLGQSFLGAWVAARLAASRPMVLALIIGALSLLGGVMNLLTIRGPTWMLIELPLYLVVAWLAGRMVGARGRVAE